MPTIESPATAKNTVHESLCKALRVKNALGIKSIVVVFDQAVHVNAVKTMRNYVIFKSILSEVGTSLKIMALLSIIAKRYADPGMWETIIESTIMKVLLEKCLIEVTITGQSIFKNSCVKAVWGFSEMDEKRA